MIGGLSCRPCSLYRGMTMRAMESRWLRGRVAAVVRAMMIFFDLLRAVPNGVAFVDDPLRLAL